VSDTYRRAAKSAAESLCGLTLEGGWVVGERIESPSGTGGKHSVRYVVSSAHGNKAFLKALDISGALHDSDDVASALNLLTRAYEHERDVVRACGTMSRIVRGLAYGQASVPTSHVGPVPYIIFELSENGDIRTLLDQTEREVSLAWKVAVLHSIALGLFQLHSENISHGDIKPSNIVAFDELFKLADMGCASQKGTVGPRDKRLFAGDPAYPPLELHYSYQYNDWDEHRLGVDLYLLGSVAVYMILQVSMTAAMLDALPAAFLPRRWAGSFDEVLPYLEASFSKILDNIRDAIGDPEISERLCGIIAELCHPDPRVRGLPPAYKAPSRFALDRYVSRLANLLQIARYRIKNRNRC
jgi:eukaryotic-like serine/threonine-protein kinase